ncbi:cleavage and polyadenylation specificity factor, putative [Plasmodium gallinaceum]|uniref:Cleavage and polyadenylation specificity factor, putative n=1 Tax=Plasmodium gallinaceum TaxID=5849 RepID=A0A1J1GQP1_PLAGA|nr:cleavage and polyadenylation specificity factor, putative [Plasmodium gallinaceum]CRG94580.1 cleavage and polyadenylation specificity factor, putative [Plasmodium gallinaceum]
MNNINVVCLGGASEVGRSCVIIESEKTSIMLDCGIHPAFMGIGCLPIYDAYDISKIDLCLITHFHMDHSGALPYLINKTRFKGRVFMTEATKSVCYLLWNDYARIEKCVNLMNKNKSSKNKKNFDDENISDGDSVVNNAYSSEENADSDYYDNNLCNNGDGNNNVLYDEDDINRTMDVIETINFRQNLEFPNVKFTAYRAGHVIGACMFLVEINNVRFLYTGDYSREIDRHIPIAEIPNIDVHVLICEGTYGIKVHDNRKKREIRFLNVLTNILNNKGKVLLPVFALGRAQELLLILEEHWEKNKHLHNIPIFYISSMATKSLCIYETFINLCGDFVKRIVNEGKNPFNFKYVKYAKSLDSILNYLYQDNNPCVIMASPGMLQNGISKNIFNIIASDKKSGVILTGYTVKGTLADELKTEPEFVTINDKVVKRKCRFEQISFSAHSDFNQTKTFIEKLKCPNVVLVHGDKNELNRLKNKLMEEKQYLSVFTPELLQKLSFHFEQNDCLLSLGKLSHHIRIINKKIGKRNKLKHDQEEIRDSMKVKEDKEEPEINNDSVNIENHDTNTKCITNDSEIVKNEKELDPNNHNLHIETREQQKKSLLLPSRDSENSETKLNYDEKEEKIKSNDIEAIIISEPKKIPILIYPSDIYNYTNLKTALIDQTVNIKYPYEFNLLYNVLSNVYEETIIDDDIIFIKDVKISYCKEEKIIKINWLSSPINDLIADSVNFLILEFLQTITSNKTLPVCNNVTDQNIYDMIISFVEENYTNVERISKIEIKKFLLNDNVRKKNEEKKELYIDGNKNDDNNKNYKRSENYVDEKDDLNNYNNDTNFEGKDNSVNENEKYHLYDDILLDYIANDIYFENSQDEINEILKFEIKDNSNNDVNVFVDIDKREVICKEKNILIKIKEILRNIEESLLPMCF